MKSFEVGNLVGICFLKPNNYTAIIYNSNISQNGEIVRDVDGSTIRTMGTATLIEITLEFSDMVSNINHDWHIEDSTEVTVNGIRYMIVGMTTDASVLVLRLVPWNEI